MGSKCIKGIEDDGENSCNIAYWVQAKLEGKQS